MKEIIPYQTAQSLAEALDNGGRFYNLFSQANDNVVTQAELATAAGVFSSIDSALLYLRLAMGELKEKDQWKILAILEPSLQEASVRSS